MNHFPRRAIGLSALVLATLVFTGCASLGPLPIPSSNSTSGVGPQIMGQTDGVRAAVDVPTDLTIVSSKRSSVILDTCAATGDGWQAEGTARNPSADDQNFFITVFFVDTKGTVLGWSQASVSASAGADVAWSAHAVFSAPLNTSCVLAAVS